jgi:hypothetical protein
MEFGIGIVFLGELGIGNLELGLLEQYFAIAD